MKYSGGWMDRITREMVTTGQEVPGLPLVEILGRSRVLVEHHRGVTRYGKDMICINVSEGHLRVEGSCLEITRMTKDQLVICGNISAVHLDGGSR